MTTTSSAAARRFGDWRTLMSRRAIRAATVRPSDFETAGLRLILWLLQLAPVTRTTMGPAPRRLARSARLAHWATTEHVVYRYGPRFTPCFTYHSLPHGCVGVANTLNDARTSYRSDM